MNVYCITCRAPLLPGNEGSLTSPPASPLAEFYQGGSALVSCIGGCGRSELFPCFLQVGLYCCTECTALLLELSKERNISHDQKSNPASQPGHPGD